eukprot:TRINITY_DN17178_c0_g1_i3.p1 TRINITY_DN17178_c0_g1~~TRINITY_DN17178_c0_g1_i3.p1  ORF type:complete len:113 (-),score=23.03 TRINITY_DN17178_c0_g1_i3:8-346(-)
MVGARVLNAIARARAHRLQLQESLRAAMSACTVDDPDWEDKVVGTWPADLVNTIIGLVDAADDHGDLAAKELITSVIWKVDRMLVQKQDPCAPQERDLLEDIALLQKMVSED